MNGGSKLGVLRGDLFTDLGQSTPLAHLVRFLGQSRRLKVTVSGHTRGHGYPAESP